MPLRRRLLRALLRAPAIVFRLGEGRLFGHRALLLIHRGRRTGRRRQTVLEVLEFDPRRREAFVLSGFGPGAEWLRNIRAGSTLAVQIGGERFAATFREVPATEAAAVLGGYERRHRRIAPLVRHVLGRLAGEPYDGTEEARARLLTRLPMLAFRPAGGGAAGDAPD